MKKRLLLIITIFSLVALLGWSTNCPAGPPICGNCVWESWKGEECDPCDEPTGCPDGLICTDSCVCDSMPTITPEVATECPVVETECPIMETECPTAPTICTGVETECPELDTLCPAIPTECPVAETKCPSAPTICTDVETECPELPTICPNVPTECPVVETKCPSAPTICTEVKTECPELPTICPEIPTECPVDDRACDGGEGCTPGYWKQPHHFGNWTSPYTPQTMFCDVFECAFPGKTLLMVLKQGGGGLKALGRHTVAALLNAASPDVAYDLSVDDVIEMFNEVYPGDKEDYNYLKDKGFEYYNKQGCPLGLAR